MLVAYFVLLFICLNVCIPQSCLHEGSVGKVVFTKLHLFDIFFFDLLEYCVVYLGLNLKE